MDMQTDKIWRSWTMGRSGYEAKSLLYDFNRHGLDVLFMANFDIQLVKFITVDWRTLSFHVIWRDMQLESRDQPGPMQCSNLSISTSIDLVQIVLTPYKMITYEQEIKILTTCTRT